MAIRKITQADLADKGVIGLPDIPALSTEEMQAKFEETVRDIAIPKINEIIDNVPTREEVEQEIDDKIVEIGSADMTKAEYGTSEYGVVKKANIANTAGTADNALAFNGYGMQIVTELPLSPDENTFYVIVE